MRLDAIAHHFDKTEARDAYGSATFLCQLAPLELFKIDGVAVKKRQLSTDPDVSMPLRGALAIEDQTYLVGHGTPDYWNGVPIRVNYVVQGADELADLTTIAKELASTAATTAYASRAFSKYSTDARESSAYLPQYEIFLAGTESVPNHSLIYIASTWHLVHESYQSTSGLMIALANEIPEPVFESVSFGSRAYNPVTDDYTSTGTSVRVMRVRWTEHFKYLSKGSESYERGDMQIFLPKTVTPKVGDVVTLSDGVWRLLMVQDDSSVWSCHVRRS